MTTELDFPETLTKINPLIKHHSVCKSIEKFSCLSETYLDILDETMAPLTSVFATDFDGARSSPLEGMST